MSCAVCILFFIFLNSGSKFSDKERKSNMCTIISLPNPGASIIYMDNSYALYHIIIDMIPTSVCENMIDQPPCWAQGQKVLNVRTCQCESCKYQCLHLLVSTLCTLMAWRTGFNISGADRVFAKLCITLSAYALAHNRARQLTGKVLT